MTSFTQDGFLDSRILVRQPTDGFRSGLDAVLLAASIPAEENDELLELGSGSGAASLCAAHRISKTKVIGLEIDARLVDLANENARANKLDDRVSFMGVDVFSLPQEIKRDFDHVFSNPPFHGENGEIPPDASRARALHDEGRLRDWLELGVKRTASHGTFTCIIRADRMNEALSALPERGLAMFPVWPRADTPAKRVILQLRKASRAPLAVLPGLVLHAAGGRYTDEAEAVLRGGASLALASPRL